VQGIPQFTRYQTNSDLQLVRGFECLLRRTQEGSQLPGSHCQSWQPCRQGLHKGSVLVWLAKIGF